MSLTVDQGLTLYRSAVDEEHKALDAHQARVQFMAGLISALFAATIAGLFQAASWLHLLALSTGPILIAGLSELAIHIARQFYERFLCAITVRAKLEQELGLTQQAAQTSRDSESRYWQFEALVPTKHLTSRQGHAASSQAWLDAHRDTGYNASVIRLFRLTQFTALGLAAVLFLTAIWPIYSTVAEPSPSTKTTAVSK